MALAHLRLDDNSSSEADVFFCHVVPLSATCLPRCFRRQGVETRGPGGRCWVVLSAAPMLSKESTLQLRRQDGCSVYSVDFDIPKKNGRFWLILDWQELNTVSKVLRFCMLQMSGVLQSVAQGAWFVSTDPRNANFTSLLHHTTDSSWDCLSIFSFNVMLYGVSLALTHVVALFPIQARGSNMPHLDVWLIFSPVQSSCPETLSFDM